MNDKKLKDIYLQQVVNNQEELSKRDVTSYIKTNEKSQNLNKAYMEVLNRKDNVADKFTKDDV